MGEWIDAHSNDEDLFIDRELTTVLQKTPGFPSGEGARLFPQTRALLFAGELQSPDAAAALTARLGRLGKDSSSSEVDSSSVNDDLSGVGAKEALEAFQFVDTVAEEVERRVANDSPHATLAGVLTTVDNGEFLFIIVWVIRMTSCFVHRVAKFVQRRGRAVPPRHADGRARGGGDGVRHE